jgi:hypothetical protein
MSRTLLVLAGAVAAIAVPPPVQAQGTATLSSPPSGPPPARTFVCHGGPGLQVRVHADPSPSWRGLATYPTKPVQMALQFAGPAAFTDADKLPAGSCAWKEWDSRFGVPPGQVYFDVRHPTQSAPNPASVRADLADAKRFYLFSFNYLIEGVPFVGTPREWIPNAASQPAGPTTEPTAAAGTDPIIRQLMCRGGPSGFEFRVIADPSPAYPDPPKHVRLAVRYRVHLASDTAELALGRMSPGSCGWDMQFGSAKPPGEVIIDIETDAQASNASFGLPRDTSIRAGLSYVDTATFRRYLSDSRHFWTFFHPDRGEPIALSHGAHEADLANLFVPIEKAPATASGPPTGGRTGVAGPLRGGGGTSTTRSGAGAPTTTGSVGGPPGSGARPPGRPTAGTPTVVRAPLQLQGVSTVLGGFTIRFSARTDASPTLLYSSEKPVRDPRNNEWMFPGGRPASGPQQVGKSVVLPGSPAVVAGTQADVVRQSTNAFRAQYSATSRAGTVGRGMVYHYIITIPATDGFSQEQYAGQLTTVSQSVRTTISSFTLLKSSSVYKDFDYNFVAWTDVGRGGSYQVCQKETCQNTGDYLRLLVFATPRGATGSVFTTPGWNTQGSSLMGIARREFDLRTVPDGRPLRAFTLRSQSGDIEFEVQGTLEVVRR